MQLTATQLDKLSNLLLELAKAMFIAGLAAPAISSSVTIYQSLGSLAEGMIFTFLGLVITKRKEYLV